MSETDWPQIAGLYEVLLRISPSPVIELNHAAAVSMVDGPARALDLVDALAARGGLDGYELLPAVRADLLRRLGRHEAAREAYRAATAATQLEPLRRLYARRMRRWIEFRHCPASTAIRCFRREDVGCLYSPHMTGVVTLADDFVAIAVPSAGRLASSACKVDSVE